MHHALCPATAESPCFMVYQAHAAAYSFLVLPENAEHWWCQHYDCKCTVVTCSWQGPIVPYCLRIQNVHIPLSIIEVLVVHSQQPFSMYCHQYIVTSQGL